MATVFMTPEAAEQLEPETGMRCADAARVFMTPEAAEQLERLPKGIHARINRLRERLEDWPNVSGRSPWGER